MNSNNNQEITGHVGNFPTCRQMSCRLDTLADTTFSCVCEVTSDVSRHVAQHDTECRHLGTKTTRRHPTYGAKPLPALPCRARLSVWHDVGVRVAERAFEPIKHWYPLTIQSLTLQLHFVMTKMAEHAEIMANNNYMFNVMVLELDIVTLSTINQ